MADDVTRPNVLHIASGDLWAGAEVQMFTLARALQNDLNIRVNVVLLNHGKLEHELRMAGIRTIVLDESKFNSVRILCQLVRTIRELRPDVIHTHRLKENILGSFLVFYPEESRRSEQPMVPLNISLADVKSENISATGLTGIAENTCKAG